MAENDSQVRIKQLELDNQHLQQENRYLRQQLKLELSGPLPIQAPSSHGPVNASFSIAEKIALYRSLFRGREDVYAVRW